MGTKLLSRELDPNSVQKNEENNDDKDEVVKNMQEEIECPRCYDVMTLCSDFDRLLYVCQECDLLLVMK